MNLPQAGSDLCGCRILVTRPQHQSAGLAGLIEQHRGIPLVFPVLDIVASSHRDAGLALLEQPQQWDIVIFVSRNAVRLAMEKDALWLKQWQEAAVLPCILTLGASTAETLHMATGLKADAWADGVASSETLLLLPALNDLAGKSVLLVRGESGRQQLENSLKEKGASVSHAIMYRREIHQACGSALNRQWMEAPPDLMVLTSVESVDALMMLLDKMHHADACNIPVAALSERIAARLRALGFARVGVAPETNDAGLLEALLWLKHNGGYHTEIKPDNGNDAVVEKTDVGNGQDMQAEDMLRESPPHRRKSRSFAWLGYSLLLLVAVLAASSYWVLQELRSRQEGLGGDLNKGGQQMLELQHQISVLQSQLATVQSQNANTQSALTTEDSKLERVVGEQTKDFEAKIQDTQSELQASISQIQRQLNQTRGDVLIADAEYLLGIANQKLIMVGDVSSAIATMNAADQRLRDSGDPAVIRIREALAKEIDQLESFKSPDVVGLSSQILSMENKIQELPLLLPHSEVAQEARHKPISEAQIKADAEMNALDTALAQLRSMVTVRRTDQAIQAILEPAQVETIRQVMLLKLEMSRASLIRGDDRLFQGNIISAREWLQTHFDHDTAIVNGMNDELQLLSQQMLRPQFPDISSSLTMLHNIGKLRMENEKTRIEPARANGAQQ